MNRSENIERGNNIRNTMVMVEEKLNTSANPATRMDKDSTEFLNKPPPTITEVENFIPLLNKKPKDIAVDFVNPDDVNLMTRTTVKMRSHDNTDPGNRARKPPTYAAKKTVAQGMMDIALITSNANQLRNVVDYPIKTASVWIVMVLIIISLLLQVAVGVSLIFKGRFDSKGKDKAAAARVNKWMMSGVFIITIINIFIAVFSTSPLPQSPPQSLTPTTTARAIVGS